MTSVEVRATMAAPRPHLGFVSRRVRVQGLATHYRHNPVVATDAPTVVLLHGLAVSHRYLVPTALALAEDHSVYVPDLPGFGLSAKPRRALDVGEHADHVLALLAELGPPAVCLVGHSFGAEIAVEVAARSAYPIDAVVLGGPTSDAAARSRTRQILRFTRDLPREDLRQAVILARDVRDAGPRRVVATLGHSVRNAIETTISGVRAPVLLVRGARDPITPVDWLERLAAAAPAGTAVVNVPGAGHNVMTTAGRASAALIRRFVAAALPVQP